MFNLVVNRGKNVGKMIFGGLRRYGVHRVSLIRRHSALFLDFLIAKTLILFFSLFVYKQVKPFGKIKYGEIIQSRRRQAIA